MLQVAFAGSFAARLEQPTRGHLTVPCEIIVSDEAAIIPRLAGVDILVAMAFTAEMACSANRLKLVQAPGAGLERIDQSALPDGVLLANAYGHETGIAEYVIGTMLALTRDLSRLDTALRLSNWRSLWAVGAAPPPVWPELAGKTLGILGYGRIGQNVARRARAFGMKVCVTRRDARQSTGDELALLGGPDMTDEVIARSDYVVISMPATADTIGSIGRKQLGLMKQTAFFINVARAEIVDEDALYEALARHAIAGAALDVWYRYPREARPTAPATRPLHELPNVLMTPHVSGWTDGLIDVRARLIAENIRRIACGANLLNLVR